MTTTNPVIEKMLAHIVAECSAVDRDAAFNEMLDECYSFDSVGGPFAHMCPSRVLLECDPVAHRCGVNDYADGQDWTEVNGETYQDDDIEKAKEEFIDELRAELSTLETERDNMESETAAESASDTELSEARHLASAIADKEAEIEACEKYTF